MLMVWEKPRWKWYRGVGRNRWSKVRGRAFNFPWWTAVPLKRSHAFAAITHVPAFSLPVLRRWILLKLLEFLFLCTSLQGFTLSSFCAIALQAISFIYVLKKTPNQYSSLKLRHAAPSVNFPDTFYMSYSYLILSISITAHLRCLSYKYLLYTCAPTHTVFSFSWVWLWYDLCQNLSIILQFFHNSVLHCYGAHYSIS